MTTSLIVEERPLPVILQPARDELLSSWLRRHVAFYGVTEPIFTSWLRLGTKNLRSLDGQLGLDQVARIVEKFRCDPNAVLEMTHALLPAEFAPLVRSSKPRQFCRSCWDRHLAADAQDVVMKSWREGWRVTCPVCGSPLSEGDRPRRSDDTVRDTSPFSKDWDAARKGEDIVLRGEPTPLASPIAIMRLLLILSWHRAEPSSKLYRKSWLLNDLIPGFDTEALRVSPSISKARPLSCGFICALGFSLVWPLPQKKVVSTVRRLRPACRPFFLRRFDELAAAALGERNDFSI